MSSSPRQLAFQVLAPWRTLCEPPAIPERADPAWADVLPRDRALAFDLITGIIRFRGMLDAVIASQLKRPLDQLEPPVRAILWLGAYQLLLHEGTRAYAAVDTSVELAKHSGHLRAAPLINAVLRNITRLKPALEIRHGLSIHTFPRNFATQIRFQNPVFPNPFSDHLHHLAVVHSHPLPLVAMLIRAHGELAATDILIRNNLRPSVILRADQPTFTPPPDAGLEPHELPRFWVATHGWSPALEALITGGQLSPQDPTAAKAVQVLAQEIEKQTLPVDKILDLCAGLGTKTMQLARTFPHTSIIATDLDAPKLRRLVQRAAALQLPTITTVPLAQVTPQPSGPKPQTFPAILLDVPCSNTGVLSRRVQARWRWPTIDLPALTALQLRLLHQGAGLLAPRGLLVYATCSIDPTENQDLIRSFLAAPPRPLTLLREELTLPAASDSPTEQYDGGYVALLQAT